MHHKRKKSKSSRAGCLFCKPHKRQGSKRSERLNGGNLRRLSAANAKMYEAGLCAKI